MLGLLSEGLSFEQGVRGDGPQETDKNMWFVLFSFQSLLQPFAEIPQPLFTAPFRVREGKVISLKKVGFISRKPSFPSRKCNVGWGFQIIVSFSSPLKDFLVY